MDHRQARPGGRPPLPAAGRRGELAAGAHRLSYASHPLTGTTEELHAAVDQLEADTVPWSYYQKVLASRAITKPLTRYPTDHDE